jgi:drug/metabolite transporter (DMT)-like permease
MYLGSFAALFSSLVWAWCSVLFTPVVARHGAPTVGLSKSLIALFFLSLTALIIGSPIPTGPVVLALSLSGIVGMGLGDVAYLSALRDAGVRQTTLLQSTAPLFLLIYSLFHGHHLGSSTIIGILCMTVGVVDVTRRRFQSTAIVYPRPVRGALLGLLSPMCQATGILLAKSATDDVGPVTAATTRILAASLSIAMGMLVMGRLDLIRASFKPAVMRDASIPSFFGTYVGVLAMMFAIQKTPPAVSGALLSLTPLFAIPVSARLLGEPIRPEVLPGSVLCIIGVMLL